MAFKDPRNTLIKILTFLGGLYFVLEFVFPQTLRLVHVSQYHENISYGFITVGAMAFGLGIINLLMLHGSKVLFLRKGWLNSFALLLGLFSMMIIALLDWRAAREFEASSASLRLLADFSNKIVDDKTNGIQSTVPFVERVNKLEESFEHATKRTEIKIAERSLSVKKDKQKLIQGYFKDYKEKAHAISLLIGTKSEADLRISTTLLRELAVLDGKITSVLFETTLRHRLFVLLNDGIFVSLGSAMFSLLAFYIAGAAYRAFRIRSFESSFMMLAAVLVMFGQISITLQIYPGFSEIRDWLLNIPNAAAFRGIRLGAAIAGLILAIRMWLSIESTSFGSVRDDR